MHTRLEGDTLTINGRTYHLRGINEPGPEGAAIVPREEWPPELGEWPDTVVWWAVPAVQS